MERRQGVRFNERGKESLFAARSQGSSLASWILIGSSYEFRLYNLDHTEVLAKVTVTRTRQ